MSGSQFSQKAILIVVCAVVVFLLAPYAGCGVAFLQNSSSPLSGDSRQTDTFGGDHQDGLKPHKDERKEPLGRIEDLLAE